MPDTRTSCTDLSFGPELDALLHGAAVAPLPDRASLRITGADATRWLNGMVTNSIQALAPGEGNYNFLLNAQGRIQGDCHIFREPGDGPATYLLITDNSQIEAIHALLDKFIIMDDVELHPASGDLEWIAVLGPKAADALQRYNPALKASNAPSLTRLAETTLLSLKEGLALHFEIGRPRIAELTEAAIGHGAIPVGPQALEAFRILQGVPRYSVDIRDRDLPQETNQSSALHFNKGCYLGQEIVERIRSRGQVHRLLTKLELTGDLPTEFPAPLEAAGKPAGEITSAACVPLPDGPKLFALGYVRREALDLKQPLSYPGGSAAPRD